MNNKCVYTMYYFNGAWKEDSEHFVASDIEEALTRAKELLKQLNGHQILGIKFYQKIWL